MNKPNIVLIIADQHRGDALGVAGHDVLLTPNMNSLARMGIRYTNAYTECPVCIPARHTMLTGMAPDKTGCVGWSDRQRIAKPELTLPSLLKANGYQTAMIGRDIHQYPKYERYGFDVLMGFEQERANIYSTYRDYFYETTIGEHHLETTGLSLNGLTVKNWKGDEKYHTTNFTVNKAIEFLENRDYSNPFFMYVGFLAPHPPFLPLKDYYDYYANRECKGPVIGEWVDKLVDMGGASEMSGAIQDGLSEEMRLARAAYYAMIQHMDEQLNLLLRRLEYEDNTYIIYTADHGEMLGDHHRFRKSQPYEGVTHIPFFLIGPGMKGPIVQDEPIGLQDILPTVCELTGTDIPNQVTGKSLLRLAKGERWREFIHGEHAPMHEAKGKDGERLLHAGFHYLTDGKMKYIWFTDGKEQLFNLVDDPFERVNLTEQDRFTVELNIWRERLIKTLLNRPEGFTDGTSLIPNRPYNHYMPHAVVDKI